MTVSDALDTYIAARIRQLEKEINHLEKKSAPYKTLERLRKKLEAAQGKMENKSEYEQAFPGLLQKKVISVKRTTMRFKSNTDCKVIQIRTMGAVYAYIPANYKLLYLGPGKRKNKNICVKESD